MVEEILKTPLSAWHRSRGAKMVPFAGYDMPLNYPLGILKEHLHTRKAAGFFDVSHMGQVIIRPKSGRIEDAARAFEALVPVSVLGLEEGRQRYAFFTDDRGGILDDLMVANRGDHLLVVVNAACKAADTALMQEALSATCEVEPLDRALIALQGPKAEAALAALHPDVALMSFMDVRAVDFHGVPAVVSRSGYTGEDGYEISLPASSAQDFVARLAAFPDVEPVGLGARDSLRLEAGLCLYGHDIDETTTPIEAGLIWAIQKVRRGDGEREGGFPGDAVILDQISRGSLRKRVGLLPEGRAPMREGTELYASEDGEAIGKITSGGFGPSLNRPVAMGYVPTERSEPGTQLLAKLRGKMLPVTVAKMPFIPPGYKRG
ncbi:glycine cleavage system aminomethyltransferase GcvT [Amaricoccus macauensis]|uniref:glycine cleavage system aminomethyltransferase GcvT n=1 Tax=Amaricoccus macauensis TaxID=57001 RepID=UPI003C79CADB